MFVLSEKVSVNRMTGFALTYKANTLTLLLVKLHFWWGITQVLSCLHPL